MTPGVFALAQSAERIADPAHFHSDLTGVAPSKTPFCRSGARRMPKSFRSVNALRNPA
jgi:hypothetical protein